MTDLSALSDDQLRAMLAQPTAPAPAAPSRPLPAGASLDNFNPGQYGMPDGAYVDPKTGQHGQFFAAGGGSYEQAPTAHLTDAQVLAGLQPQVGAGEDFWRSLPGGIEKGLTGLLGMGAAGASLAVKGENWASNLVSGKADSPEMMRHEEMAVRQAIPYGMGDLPSTQMLDKQVQSHGAPYWQPEHTPGKYGESVAEFLPSALTGGEGIAGKVLSTVLPGLGAQALGDVAHGSKWEPAARAAGGLAGLLVGHGVQGVARSPQRLVGEGLHDVSPQTQQLALGLMRDAQGRGLKVTFPEAVQQVSGNGTTLGRMQRVVEGTPEGQRVLAPQFAERPAQVSQAVHGFADQVSAPTAQPSMIGSRAQTAADSALGSVRKDINAQAQPHYRALAGQALPQADYGALAADPSYQKALGSIRGNTELNEAIKHLPDNNLAVVNLVKQHLGTLADQAAGTPLAPGDLYLASLRSGAKAGTDRAARAASPDYAAANDIEASRRAAELEPLQRGPLGSIASTDQVPGQTAALYPAKPLEGAPAETAAAVRGLNGADPTVAPALTRQHLVNALNESTQDNIGGSNQWGGAKFAAGLAGNPEQKAALIAGLNELPSGSKLAGDFDKLHQALMATGKRQAPGSLTAFNASDLAGLKSTNVGQTIKHALDPLEWSAGVGRLVDSAAYRARMKSLTDFLSMNADQIEKYAPGARAAASGRGSMLAQMLLQGPASQAGGP